MRPPHLKGGGLGRRSCFGCSGSNSTLKGGVFLRLPDIIKFSFFIENSLASTFAQSYPFLISKHFSHILILTHQKVFSLCRLRTLKRRSSINKEMFQI